MNQVQQLYQYRKSISTKPFVARGNNIERCSGCLVAKENCICEHKKLNQSQVGFVLLMSDKEILKPSNTGKLIADVMPNTFAFRWQRTEVEQALLVLLADPKWQPLLVFPYAYALPEQPKYSDDLLLNSDKKPLFILLDGSWREARRMYRKSPYLHQIPMISLAVKSLGNSADDVGTNSSRYLLREAANNEQLATAEVAAKLLAQINHQKAAQHLDLWLDVFIYQYQKSVSNKQGGSPQALTNYLNFIAQYD